MKALQSLLLSSVLTFGVCVYADQETTIPTMPSEVTLTSGRVLRNVQVVRWEKDRVVLKYTGGIDPIAFSIIKEPSPAALTAIRDNAKKAEAKINAPSNRSISGQVFVTTRGAGAYKFAGATVRAFPLSALDSMNSTVEGEISSARAQNSAFSALSLEGLRYRAWLKAAENFTPVAETSTDADGIYRLTITSKQQVFILCAAVRIAGSVTEYNIWTVPVEKADRLDLNVSNQR